MRLIHEFKLKHNEIQFTIEILLIAQSVLYRVKFDSPRAPLFITKARNINGKEFWTSIPEGRQREAESISKRIEDYLHSEKCAILYSRIKQYEETQLNNNSDPNFIFLDFPGLNDVLFTGVPGHRHAATINGLSTLNNDANFFWLIEGYKLGFNNLLNDFMEKGRSHVGYCDIYVWPSLFCLRHFIELILKDTIRKFKIGLGIISSDQIGFEPTHNISKLFQIVEELIQANPPKFTAEIMAADFAIQLASTKKLILELSSVDTYSDAFRYPFKRGRKGADKVEFINEELSVDLINLRNIGNKIIYMLECIHSESWAICSKNTANSFSSDPFIDNLGF